MPIGVGTSIIGDETRDMNRRRKWFYALIAIAIVLYMVAWVVFSSMYQPNITFYSYYVVNYEQGFVRRGLAGEILDLFPADFYFTGLLILRWLVPAIFVASLGAVAWTVGFGAGRSERRLMLMLLIPVLPFGFVRAVAMPTPDLLGGAALAAFAVFVASVKRDRSLLIASAVYGFTIGLLTLVHEAVPLLLSLGAIMAIVALAAACSTVIKRISVAIAVLPGLMVVLAILLTGNRDVSPQCDRLPHAMLDWPIKLTMGQILRGEHAYTDYHDWICRNFIVPFDSNSTLAHAMKIYALVGAAPWIASTILGVAMVLGTILIIRLVSAVPLRRFSAILRGEPWAVAFGIALLIPIFVTAADWIRWWVAIAFDVGIVYILYASRQPQSVEPTNRRTRAGFAVAIVLLALFPTGSIANLGLASQVWDVTDESGPQTAGP